MAECGGRSHKLAHEATANGYFNSQIVPVDVSLNGNGHSEPFIKDEGIRANASYEATAALQPAFNPEHSITAGNSIHISDGAAAVVLLSLVEAQQLGARPAPWIPGQAGGGTNPVLVLARPIPRNA